MKRTVLMIAVGITAVMALATAVPASADLLSGMPRVGVMGTYNQYMWQYGRYGVPTSRIGMPTRTTMQEYQMLLPRLQALQAWAHAHGMPYATPSMLPSIFAGSEAWDRYIRQ